MRVCRVLVTDQEWVDVRSAALYSGKSLGELLGDLVRDYINDPKKSPLVRRMRKVTPARPGRKARIMAP